ncbi:MAG: leucine-rich repeat domain-containing protein [Bacteroidaceae bacterium]|nr:leucine-rich repeat domain-containing protein [Bacteroidaceae bacterium]
MKRLFLIMVAFYAMFSYTLASPTCIESGIAYKVIDDQTVFVCASDCSDSMSVKTDSTLIIPSHVVISGKEYKVKGIAEAAYARCGWIKHLVISEGVEEIQWAAFEACANLVDVVLPSSIKTLDYFVFSYCLNLSSIKVDEHNAYYDSRDNCNAIIRTSDNTLIYGCKDTKIPSSVTRIIDYAFYGILIESVEIPEGLEDIRENAFCDCPLLKQVSISSTVEDIAPSAFNCSNISSIIVDERNEIYDSRNNCNAIIDKDNCRLILGCGSTIIPAGVSEIGRSAFSGSLNLQSIDIPEGITTIHQDAFYECSALRRVTLPASLTSFEGYEHFGRCESLESIVIPPKVMRLPNDIFMGCISLQEIKVDANNQTYDSRNSCNAIILTSDNELVAGCNGSIIVDGIKCIAEDAFFKSGITSIRIPASVEDIHLSSFRLCSSLKSITVDKGNKYYESDGTNSIINKKNGKLILACSNSILSPKISSIGSYAFVNTPQWLILPSGIESIEDYAFQECDDLLLVFVPKTATNIGKRAFAGCYKLSKIVVYGDSSTK